MNLSLQSQIKLNGVALPLVTLMEEASIFPPFEFRITCGLRTQAEQDILLASGASRVKSSKHQLGLAVDIVPWINGGPRWDWPLYFTLSAHIREIAQHLDTGIVWGGSWNKDFTSTVPLPRILQEAYIKSCKAAGKKPFLDGPHFELSSREIKKLENYNG